MDETLKLESGRWEILRACRVAGHVGVTDHILLVTLRALWLSMHLEWIRNEVDYLEARSLVSVTKSEVKPWRIKLTRHGRDVADYIVDCEPGIRRPRKTWGDAA